MIKIFFAKLCHKLLFFDTIICLLLGLLLYLFPKFVGDFVLQRSTDGVHWHLLRCVGGHLLASTFFSRSSGSTHSTSLIRSACIVMRLLSGVLCSFIFLHTLSVHPNLVHPVLIRTLISLSLGCALLYIILLLVSGWPVESDQLKPFECSERTVIHGIHGALYQLDTIAAVSIGLAWISSPQWLLNGQVSLTLDASHELCGRLMGLFFVCSHVISAHAMHIRSHSDLAIAAETRAVLCIFILSAQIWSQIAYTKDWSGKHWIGISLFSTWTVIAVMYRLYLWTFMKSPLYQTQDRDLREGTKKQI
uniref:Uncharacterized protein n=1 Tax=Meloidogyne enterolobii TaxID=390850 RepID=A0A6V7XHA8_MELEN|nr:unnamed protein product [Meloidogyne enterolobii]